MAKPRRSKEAPPPAKVTSLRLDPDLHERARILAIKTKSTLQAIVNEALDEYLKRRGA
jgi:predicted transcriptional regulator